MVDTLDSKSSSGNRVGVQVPLPLPLNGYGEMVVAKTVNITPDFRA